jgi:cytochrome P450
MPDLYPEADVFRPERWLTIAPSAFEFPVFGAGPHICPGFWFDSIAVKIALAAILTRCCVDLPAARIDYRTQPTLRPRQRVDVVLRRRGGGRSEAAPIAGRIRSLVKLPH